MDLRSYFSTLGRKRWLILVIALLTCAAAVLWSLFGAKPEWSGETFFSIAYNDNQETPEYKYGNFYANNASIEFARTLSGWLKSDALVNDIYRKAAVDKREDLDLLGRLFGAFSVNRVERANLNISYRSKTRENAERLGAALMDTLQGRLTEYNRTTSTRYAIVNPQSTIEEQKSNPVTSGILGLVLGLVLGILLAYLSEYASGVLTHPEQAERLVGRAVDFSLPRKSRDAGALLGAHLSRLGEYAALVGASFDPSALARDAARHLPVSKGSVVLIEGNADLRLARMAGGRRRAKGWSDQEEKTRTWGKLYLALDRDASVLPYGRSSRAELSRVLGMKDGMHVVVASFPAAAATLAQIPDGLPVVLVAILGRTRQRDLLHARRFLEHTPFTIVLLT